MSRLRPRSRWRAVRAPTVAIAAPIVAVVLALSACSGSEQSPAEARRERVEARLRDSFSAAQARCILDRADPDLLVALDRSGPLEPDADELADWSDVVVACVTDPDGTTTTTTEAPASTSTTSAPAGAEDSDVTPTTG